MNTDTPETDAETWKAGDLRIGSKVCADFARKLERERDEAREELAAVTAQRDRLAEALRKVSRSWNYGEVAQQALQSLTLNGNR
jgi:hypothetical protein